VIKAIVFDLWETLITNPHDATHEHKRLRLERIARILSTTPNSLEPAYREVWDRCHQLYWSADKDVPCRRQIEHFVEALRIEVDEPTMQALEHAYATVAIEAMPAIVPGAAELLSRLAAGGHKLGLISNTGRTPGYALRTILEQLNLAHYFDVMVSSNEHGECKPQMSIFDAVRAALDLQFEEMLFVGDNLYVDVYGAQRCGMRAVHFIPPQRGTAVAPDVDHGLTIEPDATIYDLRELLSSEPLSRLRERVPRSGG
jgi:putative hydrolase of the HAD superfamily